MMMMIVMMMMMMICKLINPGQIIVLCTPPDDKRSFYLVSVNEVKTAENDIHDAFQHFALKGEKYLRKKHIVTRNAQLR